MNESTSAEAASGGVGPLAGVRVIDAADIRNMLCGKLLADMGAVVLRLDEIGAYRARDHGSDAIRRRDWLNWQAYNAGKQSVLVDLGQPKDRDLVRDLVRGSDVFLE